MANFINGIPGLVSEKDLLETGFIIERPNDPLEGLFPDRETDNLVAEWYTMAHEYQIPVMAQFHAFDVPAQKSDRAPVDEQNVEKCLIKSKRNTSELLRQLLKRGVRLESELYKKVMDDAAALNDEVVTRAKVARHELIATGQVTIKENGLDEVIDYGVPANHKNKTLDVGSGAKKGILEQIQDIIDQAVDEGVTLNGIVCGKAFIAKLRRNPQVQIAINGNTSSGILIGRRQIEDFLAEEFDLTQVVIDEQRYAEPYKERVNNRPVVKAHRYYPADRVTFFGTYNGMSLGAGLWGAPPEVEIANFAQVSGGENPFVYITQWAEKDPAILWTKASALYVPVLYAPQSLFIASIVETKKA